MDIQKKLTKESYVLHLEQMIYEIERIIFIDGESRHTKQLLRVYKNRLKSATE